VALAVFGMTIHAQIGLAVAGGAPVAAGKVETLEQVYEGQATQRRAEGLSGFVGFGGAIRRTFLSIRNSGTRSFNSGEMPPGPCVCDLLLMT